MKVLPRPGQSLDGFLIERELGRGGMGAVFLASRAGAPVALKVMLDDGLDPELRVRFEREAQAAAAVGGHPGVVSIHSYRADGPLPYIVSDFVAGEDLGRLLAREGKELSGERLLGLLEQLAGGLDHIHRAGIIHRDLKPANVLVRDDGQLLLTDFGLARRRDLETLTRSGELLGTPAYMAPEQLVGGRDALCPQTDLWAFAVLAYELLSGGSQPFQGASLVEVAHSILEASPVPLSRQRPELSPGVDEVFSVGFQREPSDRHPSAMAFVEDLRSGLSGSELAHRRARPGLARRVLLALSLLFVLALGLGYWQHARSKQDIRVRRLEALRPSLGRHWVHHILARLGPKFASKEDDSDCVRARRVLSSAGSGRQTGALFGLAWTEAEAELLKVLAALEPGGPRVALPEQRILRLMLAMTKELPELRRDFSVRLASSKSCPDWALSPRALLKILAQGRGDPAGALQGLGVLRETVPWSGKLEGLARVLASAVLRKSLFGPGEKSDEADPTLLKKLESERGATAVNEAIKLGFEDFEGGRLDREAALRGWGRIQLLLAHREAAALDWPCRGPKLHLLLAAKAKLRRDEPRWIYHQVRAWRLDGKVRLEPTPNVHFEPGDRDWAKVAERISGLTASFFGGPATDGLLRRRLGYIHAAGRLGVRIDFLPGDHGRLDAMGALDDLVREHPREPVALFLRGRRPDQEVTPKLRQQRYRKQIEDLTAALETGRLSPMFRGMALVRRARSLIHVDGWGVNRAQLERLCLRDLRAAREFPLPAPDEAIALEHWALVRGASTELESKRAERLKGLALKFMNVLCKRHQATIGRSLEEGREPGEEMAPVDPKSYSGHMADAFDWLALAEKDLGDEEASLDALLRGLRFFVHDRHIATFMGLLSWLGRVPPEAEEGLRLVKKAMEKKRAERDLESTILSRGRQLLALAKRLRGGREGE